MTIDITVKPQSGSGSFDSKIWYRLVNAAGRYALDVVNDGSSHVQGLLRLALEADYTSQYWQIKTRGDGSIQIRNLFLGPNRALDVYGYDKTAPYIGDVAYVSSQYWSITPWGDGNFHLENAFSGMFLSLDSTDDGTGVALRSGPDAMRSTQRWSLTEIGPITQAEFLT